MDAIDTLGRDSRKLIKRILTVPHPRVWVDGDLAKGGWSKTQKPRDEPGFWIVLTGRLPTLPHTCACSTIGAERLNCRVRDGNGWVPLAKVTQKLATKGLWGPLT